MKSTLKPRIEEIPEVSAKASALFRNSLVWDNLLTVFPTINGPFADVIFGRWQRTGVNYISVTVADRPNDAAFALSGIGFILELIREKPGKLVLATTTQEIVDAKANGKLALGLNFQCCWPIGNDLAKIGAFRALGVGQMNLAYNVRNFVGDGCAEPDNAGLSLFGRAAVKEMNRVGIIVDGSHSGHRTTMEAMELSDKPFVFSHSNPFSIVRHYRSVKDDQIKSCAATGGVVGINGVGKWLGNRDADTEAIFRCLDYTVELVGSDHVGFGFDYIYDINEVFSRNGNMPLVWPPFDGQPGIMYSNFAAAEQMVALTQMMLDHGYSDEAIVGILGANWMRIAQCVWRDVSESSNAPT